MSNIGVSINVSKIDKRKLVEGKKGTYLNLVLFENDKDSEASEYGDYIVKQQGEKGEKLPILGNGKIFHNKAEGRKRHDDDREETKSNIPF